MTTQTKHPGRDTRLAVLLAFLLPGLGQVYNGELVKGASLLILILVAMAAGVRLALLLPDNLLIYGALAVMLAGAALYIFGIVDAFHGASRSEASFLPRAYNRWYFYLAAWLLGHAVFGIAQGYVRDHFLDLDRTSADVDLTTDARPDEIKAAGGEVLSKAQDEFLKRAVTFVKAVAPFARANKVQLTVENLGPYLNREEVLKPIMEAVPNDEVGSALDITNMYWFGYPPARIYELARNFAPHVRYVHAKNIKYPPEDRERQRDMGWEYGKYAEPIATGDIDWDKILEIYFAAGFKGDVVIEDDSLPKFDAAGKKRTIKEGAAYLRELIDKNSQPAGAPRVQFETSLGSFVVELDPDKAPQTVENFLRYVDEKFYDGTIFHRIMSDFMIQGGGFTGLNQYKSQGLNPPIQNEAKQGLKNVRGTIAMARTGAPHSATSQFFINVKDNAMLDHPSFDGWGYCAFGRVVEGMDVIDRIKAVQVRPNPANPNEQSEPIDPPVIKQVTRVR